MQHGASGFRWIGYAVAVTTLGWAGAAWVRAVQAAQSAQALQPAPIIQPTPGWETKRSNPGDPNYHLPAYPIAFVKVPVVENNVQVCNDFSPPYNCSTYYGSCNSGSTLVTAKEGDYHVGTDVLSANDPNVGNELWIYLPATGAVKRLFPRPIHETTHVIDFSWRSGSVVEPNVSEDGTRIYFAYYQDAVHGTNQESDGSSLPLSGSDLYAIDIGPLLTDPLANIDTLLVTRLTQRQYATGSSTQTAADRNKDAMNPALASGTSWQPYQYGTSYLHPVEVRTRKGLFLAYASDKRRMENSNPGMNRANHNFNLHMAPILPDGTLGPEDNQLQYYTTTSALSPTPLREGLSFSYQASTEDGRMWQIQGMDSEGSWYPILGYGSMPELYHLATFCASSSGDYLVAARYYNANNEGFGSLWKQNLDPNIRGKNTYNNLVQGQWKVPMQYGSQELTNPPGISLSSDYPSPVNTASGAYYGKFTSPRCGGLDELYFAYTPTSANSKSFDNECNKSIYHSYIGFRPSLTPWTPGESVANNGHSIVIRKTNDDSSLVWPVPIVPWSVRSNGDAVQRYSSASIAVPTPHVAPGEPFSIVGTSALGNTDRRPFECYLAQPGSGAPRWYSPWGVWDVNQENDLIADNQDGWTYVGTPGPGNNFCLPPDSSQILGIAVNLTSNRTNLGYYFGYTMNSGGNNAQYFVKQEAARLLGVYSIRGQYDQSFRALIPANVPFEFQAIDKDYGMKLTDVRSWHSLKPQEERTNCGGCHQHDVNGAPVPWTGTLYAATHPPLDMVRATPSIGYDATCHVKLDPPDTAPAESYPEWRADIWPLMDTFCGGCHNSTTGNNSGNLAISWPDTSQASGDAVFDQIVNRRFASVQRGALGSQVFWAVRGERTDNRSNSAYPANYGCTTQSCQDHPGQRWGFHYASAHDALQSNCSTGLPGYADWAFKVGKWIDNHMPRDTGYGMGFKFDWYHPTADSAVVSSNCAPTQMRVGWWDDSNQLKSIQVWLNNDSAHPVYAQVWPGAGPYVVNGSATFGLPAVGSSDTVTVEVRDAVDNRQIYRKRVDELVADCVVP